MTQVTGWNGKFAIESATPGTYTEVADVTAITLPTISREAPENTTLASTGKARTYLAGSIDFGEVGITINWVPAAQASDVLYQAIQAGLDNFRVTTPSGVTLTFAGVTTSYAMGELEKDTPMTAELTVKVSGVITIAAAA